MPLRRKPRTVTIEVRFGKHGNRGESCMSVMTKAAWQLLLFFGLMASARAADEPAASAPATYPAKQKTDPLAAYDQLIGPKERSHRSYQPVKRPGVPAVTDARWVRNPIDSFVLAKLEDSGWRPASAAQRAALLRRVFLDVVGLPPSIDEQSAFAADKTPDAWERLVDDLLSRPGLGERWARHWLDLVRFAETNGYERDATKPFAWRYRDYVIRAMNADRPYNRFVIEQLAGDELPDADGDTLLATTFLRLGPWDDEPADPQTDRFDQLDDIVSTTSQVFLGLTLGCCRCHNHKFESLTQADYYRMVAVFNPLVRPQDGRNELTVPVGTPSQLAEFQERHRRLEEVRTNAQQLRDAFRVEHLKTGRSKIPATAAAAFLESPKARDDATKKLVEKYAKQLDNELAQAMPPELRQRLAELDAASARLRAQTPDLPEGYLLREPAGPVADTHILMRGNPGQPGAVVQPGVPTVLTAAPVEFAKSSGPTSFRRKSLADWIVRPDNPLAARVIVNRVWQFHFGEGIVRSSSDFGVMGEPPTHPELLNWLAHWFVHDADWSLKRLHRLILTSNTYRMSKRSNPEYVEEDAENRRLWRFPYRRLEVESIRDSILYASGRLNRAMYGPSAYPEMPTQVLEAHSDPGKVWPAFDELAASRRTVYVFLKRSLIVPMLEVLDLCDTTRTSAQRSITTVAPQALTMLNGSFVNRQAEHLARRLEREAGTDARSQVELAYRLVLCRAPEPKECDVLLEYLAAESRRISADAAATPNALAIDSTAAASRARMQLCRILFNLNEFVYPD